MCFPFAILVVKEWYAFLNVGQDCYATKLILLPTLTDQPSKMQHGIVAHHWQSTISFSQIILAIRFSASA